MCLTFESLGFESEATPLDLCKRNTVSDTSQNMKLAHTDPNNETKCERLYTGLDLISHTINLLNMNLRT